MTSNKCGLIWALVSILLILNAESIRLKNRMLGGTAASKGQFPYMVSLLNRQNGFLLCGGAIITNFYTLSSAYCTEHYAIYPDLLVVYLGAWHSHETVTNDVAEIKIPSIYHSTTKANDISLIRLANEIMFNDFVKPIALPSTDFPNKNGLKLLVSGFGLWFIPKYTHDSSVRSKTLLYDETTSLTHELCVDSYAGISNADFPNPEAKAIGENVICTSNTLGKGLCYGDRGNPLVANDQLVGVASWYVECSSDLPNIYTKVYPYLNWIQRETMDTF